MAFHLRKHLFEGKLFLLYRTAIQPYYLFKFIFVISHITYKYCVKHVLHLPHKFNIKLIKLIKPLTAH